MPRAVTNALDTERFELKTAPPDGPDDEQGFVVLRQMSFGEFEQRRMLTSDMRVKGGGKDFEGIMQLMNEKVTPFEFKTCIVEHNLTDESGELLDFTKASTLKKLNPRIGQEIGRLIDKMNQFDEEGEEALGN